MVYIQVYWGFGSMVDTKLILSISRIKEMLYRIQKALLFFFFLSFDKISAKHLIYFENFDLYDHRII